MGESNFTAVLVKPTTEIREQFNLHRELVIVISSYSKFEPRAFDVLDVLDVQELRLEEICSIIISNDDNIKSSISNILKSNQESRIFIPFSFSELSNRDDYKDFFLNRMRESFYSRDLFGIQDPLRKETYFFGRKELVQELVNKHLCSENSGIFGLRKTGKTSILYSVERSLKRKQTVSTFIDCQTLHNKPWNLALRQVVETIAKDCGIRKSIYEANFEKYERKEYASDTFYNDIDTILCNNEKKSILLIFDEIENITFATSASDSWRNGDSFVKFWQSIRSTYQRIERKQAFTYLIAGTNPKCIESPTINGVDNPIFHQFTPLYIEPFDLESTKEMLGRLGGYMGMKFTDEVCTHIKEDFGGHPLLMRQICSYIHRKDTRKRPIIISKPEYLEYKSLFYSERNGFSQYASMILDVLTNWYPDEYEMLKMLACGDVENFRYFSQSQDYIYHLISYGIIAEDSTSKKYHFQIEAFKDYLIDKNKYKRLALSDDEKEKETQERRSGIEKALRRMVKRQLKSSLGEDKAREEMIKILYGPKEIGHKSNIPYKDFFEPDKHKVYLKSLFDVISRNYSFFENLFGVNKESFESRATLLNTFRRTDAHSAPISDPDFETFRGIATWFEDSLSEE